MYKKPTEPTVQSDVYKAGQLQVGNL
jgi:hypothetical protein